MSAIVGNATAKLALMLLAIEPRLKGILLSSSSGSARTTIARAARSFFARVVQVPTSVSEDRLLGGLDLEGSLRSGKRQTQNGLLAKADGGLLFLDDVDRLDPRLLPHIAAALDTGVVRVEREGMSFTAGAEIVCIGTYNSVDGSIPTSFQDRVGLLVSMDDLPLPDQRVEIIERVMQLEDRNGHTATRCHNADAILKNHIQDARSHIGEIKIADLDLHRIAEASLQLGVAGNRADLFAMLTARAHAAFWRRDAVVEEDLIQSIRLVLLPRATRAPQVFAARGEDHSDVSENHETNVDDWQKQGDEAERMPGEVPKSEPGVENRRLAAEELVIKAIDGYLEHKIIATEKQAWKSVRLVQEGKRFEKTSDRHGRAVSPRSNQPVKRRLAIVPTLTAAAPWQRFRKRSGRHVANKLVHIAPEDLRYQRYKNKAGTLFIFAVDASGSMAVNRMAQAKGAMIRLLQEAYIQRDKVALISFRRQSADILLAPTRSVELAKAVVEAIPTGGATPIAEGLAKSMEVADIAKSQGFSQAMIILFTDGRANIGRGGDRGSEREAVSAAIPDELRRIGAVLQSKEIPVVVIDTKPKYVKGNDAVELADLLGGQYRFLPRPDEVAIYTQIKELALRTK